MLLRELSSYIHIPGNIAIYILSTLLTSAFATLAVRPQRPSLVACTFDSSFLLHAALATLQMLGAEALNLAGLVVCTKLHASRTGTQDALTRSDGAVVTTASVINRAKI